MTSSDLQATLDAIDEVAVHECGHCSEPLPRDGESLDFCDPRCQQAWTERHNEVVDLVGYEEPEDLPVHAFNLTELYSPETTPARPDWLEGGPVAPLRGRSPLAQLVAANHFTFNITVDTSRMEAAFEAANEAVERFAQRARGITSDFVVFDEIRDWQPIGLINQITVSDVARVYDVPEALIVDCREPFGSDFDFEHRPAATLPDEPPAAVMPDLPPRDWQALVDARVSRPGPQRPVRAPRHLGRTR